MVTGIDIIKEQIWIAFTGNTALKQSDINPRGHAIECRINAEDASKNFQPSPGTITMCHQPSGFRTRVDGSIYQGYKQHHIMIAWFVNLFVMDEIELKLYKEC